MPPDVSQSLVDSGEPGPGVSSSCLSVIVVSR